MSVWFVAAVAAATATTATTGTVGSGVGVSVGVGVGEKVCNMSALCQNKPCWLYALNAYDEVKDVVVTLALLYSNTINNFSTLLVDVLDLS
ncbi:hypothetical protein M0802_012146 [Mischocyttarus mexicanus]|nr:hypothetical protein M0802_012146 [Mischocyttarus mexicanus]